MNGFVVANCLSFLLSLCLHPVCTHILFISVCIYIYISLPLSLYIYIYIDILTRGSHLFLNCRMVELPTRLDQTKPASTRLGYVRLARLDLCLLVCTTSAQNDRVHVLISYVICSTCLTCIRNVLFLSRLRCTVQCVRYYKQYIHKLVIRQHMKRLANAEQ